MVADALELAPKAVARASDLDDVYALLPEASEFLRERGIAQWRVPYPRERFARDVASGAVWYWRAESAVAATLTVSSSRPDYYEGDLWLDPKDAWYLTRFAVARRFARRGIGAKVLDQVAIEAAASGVQALRLDVNATNPFLERYYLEHDFRRVAAAQIRGEPSVLLERECAFLPA